MSPPLYSGTVWPHSPRRDSAAPTLRCRVAAHASETDESAPFAHLAKRAASSLATGLAGDNAEAMYSKLQEWLTPSPEELREAARTDQSPGTESAAHRLYDVAGEVAGLAGFTLDNVKAWLSNPSHTEEQDDSQMVAAIMERLLRKYEHQFGEAFQLSDANVDRLHSLAKGVMGSSLSRRLLKGLVRAYLGMTEPA
eukprot:scaffold20.g7643.t1